MKQLIFATNNAHKMSEVARILDAQFKLISLKDIGFVGDIPETMDTIEGNALQKARFIWEKYGMDCVADDTGLEVNALNGAPGVYSARYAGASCNAKNNIQKLLKEMDGELDRRAHFKTVAALILDGKEYLFNGIIHGTILTHEKGDDGFGYDAVFQPLTYDLSFAQMTADQKNSISHRALAFHALADFLKH